MCAKRCDHIPNALYTTTCIHTYIYLLKPDEENGMVVVNKTDYFKTILKIINDTNKSAKLESDSTFNREGGLQHFLRKLKMNGKTDKDIYKSIYPSGSQPARIYGLPKMHKL